MSATCRALRLQLAAYADDELGVDAAIEVERHLEACGACRRAVGRQRHLARALRELHPADAPPDGFEARLRFGLFGPTTVRRRAAAGMIVLAIAGIGVGMAARHETVPGHDARPAVEPLRSDARIADPAPAVAEAAAIHRDADAGAVALALASADVATVNGWLHAHLPFTGTIGDPGSAAVALTGATRVMLGDRPAGLVRYRLGGRTVSLFLIAEPVWSEGAPPVRVGRVDFRVFQRRGVDLIGWSHGAISYLLVSEDGLTTGDACATCHDGSARGSIAEFVAAVAGPGHGPERGAGQLETQNGKERT